MKKKDIIIQHKTDILLDKNDKKILYHLDLNSRQSAKQIAKKIGSNKDTVNFRIHRLIENDILTRFSTETNPAKFGYQIIKVYFQFQNFDENIEKEFFDYLNSLKYIGWTARSSGRWDALFGYWTKSSFEFYKDLIKMLNKFSKYIYHKEIIHNINWYYYNRKWLHPEQHQIYPVLYGEEPTNEKIDRMNKQILEMLIKNARYPIKDIAIKLDTSSQNVINRIKNMKQKGIITKFGIDLNYKKLDLEFCKTFIYLDNITLARLKKLYDYCAKQPRIFALTTTLGVWDMELEFEVLNFEEMMNIMDKIKNKFNDMIRNYESIIITRQTEVRYIGE